MTGLAAFLVQVAAGQNRRIAGSCSMDVDVLEAPGGEEICHRGVVERRGARTVPLGVGLNLREWPLDLLSARRSVLSVMTYFVGCASLVLFSCGAGARVDVGEVGCVGRG